MLAIDFWSTMAEEESDVLDEIIDRGPEGFGPGEFAPVSFRSFSGSADIESRPNWQIVNTWEAAEAFHRLIFHPKIVGAVAQLTRATDLMVRTPAVTPALSAPLRTEGCPGRAHDVKRKFSAQVWHDQVQYKPAEYGGATTWHQDAPLWPSILPNTMVTAWIPFDEVTAENGATGTVTQIAFPKRDFDAEAKPQVRPRAKRPPAAGGDGRGSRSARGSATRRRARRSCGVRCAVYLE